MEIAIDYIYDRTKQLEKGLSFLTYLAGGALIACYFLNRKIKKLNNEIKVLHQIFIFERGFYERTNNRNRA